MPHLIHCYQRFSPEQKTQKNKLPYPWLLYVLYHNTFILVSNVSLHFGSAPILSSGVQTPSQAPSGPVAAGRGSLSSEEISGGAAEASLQTRSLWSSRSWQVLLHRETGSAAHQSRTLGGRTGQSVPLFLSLSHSRFIHFIPSLLPYWSEFHYCFSFPLYFISIPLYILIFLSPFLSLTYFPSLFQSYKPSLHKLTL